MKIVEILCNPRPGSFNLALAVIAAETLKTLGHEVVVHDLYEEGFDPVLSGAELARGYSLDSLVQVHCQDLAAADGLVVFHPDWWGQPPAVLKGWIDRVFRQGVAYDLDGDEFAEKGWRPLLVGKKGLVFCTSDLDGSSGTLERLWEDQILGRCGMDTQCHVLRSLRRTDAAGRRDWMVAMIGTLRAWFPGPEAALTAR